MYSLWHFNLWVIDSIACRTVIFQFIAFSSSLSNPNSFSSQPQSVSSNHEHFLDCLHYRARFTQLRQRSLKAQEGTLPSLGKVERTYCVLHPWHHLSCSQQPCSADTTTISILGYSRGVPCTGFGVSEPRSGFVTHTLTMKPWASYLTSLRLGFLISRKKGIIMPGLEGCWED